MGAELGKRRLVGLLGLLGLLGLFGLFALAWVWRAAPEAERATGVEADGDQPAPAVDRVAAAELPWCPELAPMDLEREVELRVFLGPEVDVIRAAEAISAIRRYWAAWGVELRVDGEPRAIEQRSMFVGGFDELEGQAEDDRAALLYRELRAFLLAHAVPARGGVNLVIVRDVVHPRAAAAAVLGDLVGLTLSPELLGRDKPGARGHASILAALGLDEFEPTVLLSDRHLQRLASLELATTVAHEFGHALGLAHHDDPANLMARDQPACLPGLDAAQIERLRAPTPGSAPTRSQGL